MAGYSNDKVALNIIKKLILYSLSLVHSTCFAIATFPQLDRGFLLRQILFFPGNGIHSHGLAQVLVQQVARLDVAEGRQPVFLGVGREGIQRRQQELDLRTVQAILVLAQVARQDGEFC